MTPNPLVPYSDSGFPVAPEWQEPKDPATYAAADAECGGDIVQYGSVVRNIGVRLDYRSMRVVHYAYRRLVWALAGDQAARFPQSEYPAGTTRHSIERPGQSADIRQVATQEHTQLPALPEHRTEKAEESEMQVIANVVIGGVLAAAAVAVLWTLFFTSVVPWSGHVLFTPPMFLFGGLLGRRAGAPKSLGGGMRKGLCPGKESCPGHRRRSRDGPPPRPRKLPGTVAGVVITAAGPGHIINYSPRLF